MIILIDYIGVGIFAATGALLASRKNLDIVGFIFFAGITGIGGGTLRDIILDTPVFWIKDSTYGIICVVTGIFLYFSAGWIGSRWKWLLWLDAFGLSVFASIGAAKGLEITGSQFLAVFTGILTATFGGILRDVVAGEPSVLLRQEIYISAAGVGALAYVLAFQITEAPPLACAFGFLSAFFLRAGALWFGWSLSSWKASSPKRD